MSLFFNGAAAKLGSISAQPVASTSKLQLSTLSVASAFAQIKTTKLDSFIDVMKGSDTFFIDRPVFALLPAFKTVFNVAKPIDTRLAGKEPGPDVKFSPYEELTGVSKTRPEILLVTNFQPIFDGSRRTNSSQKRQRKDSNTTGLNAVGEFLDAQIQLQHLRHQAMVKLVNDMKNDSAVKAILDEKQEEFSTHINSLTNHVNVLYEIVTDIDRLKGKLNIKNGSSISYERLVARYFGNIVKTTSTSARTAVTVTPEFDVNALNDVSFGKILSNVGFDSKKVMTFTSTKTFLQSAYELGNLWRGDSFNILGLSTIEQREDQSPIYIHKHKPAGFKFDPTLINSPTLTDINSVDKENILAVANGIKLTFDTMFKSANFTSNETRLAFLCNFLSREYTMSQALGQPSTRKFVADTYNYPISDVNDNEEVIDVILGYFGDKITDRTDVFSRNSLANAAQKIVDNVSVLPFESDYIDFEQSVYTPGSVYLLDKALEITNTGFNLTNLQSFSNDLGGHLDRFVSAVGQFGLLPTQKRIRGRGDPVGDFGDHLRHGRVLFDSILGSFFDTQAMLPRDNIMSYDSVTLFNSASSDNYLKALLFLYVYMKTWRADTHTEPEATAAQKAVDLRLIGQPPPPALPAVFEKLIIEIDNRINNKTPTRSGSVFASVIKSSRLGISTPSKLSVVNELRDIGNTNKFLKEFFNHFSGLYSSFTSAGGIVNSHSRYSAIPSVALMMIVFETLLTTVTTYLPKTIVGQFNTRSSSSVGTLFYNVTAVSSIFGTAKKNSLSVNTVRTKLNTEADAIVKFIFGIVSSLTQLKDAVDSTTKSLKSEIKVKQLNEIIGVVGSTKLLSLSLTPQQIFLMKSSLDDILGKLQQGLTSQDSAAGNVDFDQRSATRDDVALLDDSLISTNLKKMLMAFLSTDKFSSAKGHNVRLLTVGVPSGFSQKLRERVKLEKIDSESFNSKQIDVIRVNVYKIDVEHQDLIFKPQQFLFELSRFVPRTTNVALVSETASIDQILDAMPLRDYSLNLNLGLDVPGQPSTAFKGALTHPAYSFLSLDQRKQMFRNHATSYLLELYIRLLTGVSVAEFNLFTDPSGLPFSSASPLIIEKAVETVIEKIVSQNSPTPSPSRVRSKTTANLVARLSSTRVTIPASYETRVFAETNLSAAIGIFPPRVVAAVTAAAPVTDTMKKARTVYSDHLSESKRIFLPKMFDRVFNIAVDPDDFEIDVEETLKTPSGKEAFDKLLRQGIVVGAEKQATFFGTSGHSAVYKIKERHVNENDVTFEKYFITIDTVMDEVI